MMSNDVVTFFLDVVYLLIFSYFFLLTEGSQILFFGRGLSAMNLPARLVYKYCCADMFKKRLEMQTSGIFR
jgi:hypothetical protein